MKTECPYCGQHYEINAEYKGCSVECLSCKREFIIAPRQSHLLADMNPEQRAAVTAQEGYIRVIAGAGTGKTRVLTHRLAYMIEELHIPADSVLSVTFTNKAAKEMNYRIRRLLGNSAKSRVSTFHGFCNTVLREDISRLCYPANFTIMDEDDQKLLIREIFSELGLSSRDFSFKKVKDFISNAKKNTGYVHNVIMPGAENLKQAPEDDTTTRIFKLYLWKQRKNFFLDYDDLIQFALYMFETIPMVLEKWQERLQYIQVDEFQDVNTAQYNLVMLLSQKHKNLFIVGDPDQTIYEWRGANVNLFLDFPADITIKLNANYRSSSNILSASNSLISHNQSHIENPLISIRGAGTAPVFFAADWEHSESDWIAKQIKILSQHRPYADCAILCRSLFQTRKIEESLIRRNIPYHIYNGTDFYKRAEVKDALSYLRLVAGEDDLAFLRIINSPSRGMGKQRIELLKQISAKTNLSLFQALSENLHDKKFARCSEFVQSIRDAQKMANEGMNISDLLNIVLKSTGYESALLSEGDEARRENLEELKNSIRILEKEEEDKITLSDYLTQITLYSERAEDADHDAVKIMTIHTAKGLEFPCVFVAGLNEGTLPNSHAVTPEAIEQERRVAYVALTRAEELLFLSSDNPDRFSFQGEKLDLSRFVYELSNKSPKDHRA